MAVSGRIPPAQAYPLLQCSTPFRACCYVGDWRGKIYVDVKIDHKDEEAEVEQATLVRHARCLLAGEVYVPGSVRACPNSEKMDLV
jgi:hypothetical protein